MGLCHKVVFLLTCFCWTVVFNLFCVLLFYLLFYVPSVLIFFLHLCLVLDPVELKRKRQKYGDEPNSTMLRHFQEPEKSSEYRCLLILVGNCQKTAASGVGFVGFLVM